MAVQWASLLPGVMRWNRRPPSAPPGPSAEDRATERVRADRTTTGPIDLADEPRFTLGSLEVHPPTLEVVRIGRRESLQPRVMQILVALAKRRGEVVSRDELMAAGWGGDIVGEDALHRCIALIRRLSADTGAFGLETIPRVGYRLTERESRVAPIVRPLIWVVGAIVLATIAGWAYWRLSEPAGQNGRVEVALFEPLRPDPELRRFSVALGDAVVRVLASNGIETAQQRDAGGDTDEAEFRIAGAVDRDGDRIVVNSQIIDRQSGSVLWSGRIDRPAAALVGFQEEAASVIGDTLHCALGRRAASNKPMSSAVFGMFLNACHVRRGSDPLRFLEITRRLADAAPELSVAHSLHAVALAAAPTVLRPRPLPPGELGRAVRASAERALALDPRNGEAYYALGISHAGRRNWLVEERYYLRAASLRPNLTVFGSYHASMLREVGRLDEALDANRRAVAADPFSGYQLRSLAFLAASAGDHTEAAAVRDRLALIDPERARDARYQAAFWWEDPQKARPLLRAYAKPDATEQEFACLNEYLERVVRTPAWKGLPAKCAGVQPDWRVRMLAREGDLDAAYAEVARVPAGDRIFYLFYPEMKRFRQDPRFMPLASRIGLVDYWVRSGRWPDFCRERDLPYDCRAVALALKPTAAPAADSGRRGTPPSAGRPGSSG